MISIDSYKSQLSQAGQKILTDCEKLIDALRLNADRNPSHLCLNRKSYNALQGAVNTVVKKQNAGMPIKSDPPEIRECSYRGVGFTVQ